MDKLLHVGVVRNSKRGGGYLITAEYRSGYLVLARFKTLKAANAALPKVKREFEEILNA